MAKLITTYLEMRSPDQLRPKACADERFWIGEATERQWQVNRFFYLTVGEGWRWNERRKWTDDRWRDYVASERLRTLCAYFEGAPAGYCELLRDEEGGVEIIYFGLMPAFIGRGLGGALLTRALEEAWKMSPTRVWVHTCNFDHPSAIANYQARGMVIFDVETEELDPPAKA